ncbi:hypothetical protein OKW21_003054 [Catalinimonas alkaloidigena]|nr:hypothetical protein [Catalinimonas alkaloidigena]MDF9797791.1 hypothetical protein [Catalinimonas alkaloidigena]
MVNKLSATYIFGLVVDPDTGSNSCAYRPHYSEFSNCQSIIG